MIFSEKKFQALGTDIHLQVSGIENDALSDEVEDLYRKMEKIFSRFDPGSELSRLNGNLGKWMEVSEPMAEVLEKCLALYGKSSGIFDPRVIGFLEALGYGQDFRKNLFPAEKVPQELVPHGRDLSEDLQIKEDEVFFRERMDLSGIAKAYIADQAAGFLRKRGVENFLLDSGGDIMASGKDKTGNIWTVSLEGFSKERLILSLPDLAVATSGTSRRKWEAKGEMVHHLIDPRNPGKFSFDLRSVTVFGKDVEEADFWAKLFFLLGKEEGKRRAEEEGAAALFLDRSGNLSITERAKQYIFQQ